MEDIVRVLGYTIMIALVLTAVSCNKKSSYQQPCTGTACSGAGAGKSK